jgi:predicted transcriptional regulator
MGAAHRPECPKCEGTGYVLDFRQIGADMRRARIRAGLSLRSVAARLHVTPSYLSDLELGRRHYTKPLRELTAALLKNGR